MQQRIASLTPHILVFLLTSLGFILFAIPSATVTIEWPAENGAFKETVAYLADQKDFIDSAKSHYCVHYAEPSGLAWNKAILNISEFLMHLFTHGAAIYLIFRYAERLRPPLLVFGLVIVAAMLLPAGLVHLLQSNNIGLLRSVCDRLLVQAAPNWIALGGAVPYAGVVFIFQRRFFQSTKQTAGDGFESVDEYEKA